jgi:hypothetical protein
MASRSESSTSSSMVSTEVPPTFNMKGAGDPFESRLGRATSFATRPRSVFGAWWSRRLSDRATAALDEKGAPRTPLKMDLWWPAGRIFSVMAGWPTACVASIATALLAAGCGGTSVSHTDPAATPPGTSLARRPLALPHIELPGGFAHNVPGECLSGEDTVAGAIHLHGVPGEGSLGPPTQIRSSPAYARITEGTPRIPYWNSMEPVPGSDSRAGRSYWITRDTYSGPLLVRGGRIDQPGELGFGDKRVPLDQLRLPAGPGPEWDALRDSLPQGWRAAEVPIRVSTPGCYAIQVDGIDFSFVATFAVAA